MKKLLALLALVFIIGCNTHPDPSNYYTDSPAIPIILRYNGFVDTVYTDTVTIRQFTSLCSPDKVEISLYNDGELVQFISTTAGKYALKELK